MSLTNSEYIARFLLVPLLLLGSDGIASEEAISDTDVLVELLLCDGLPDGAEVLGKVAANSRRSSARTTGAKKNYVTREMQRQGRLFEADALVLLPMRKISEHKPQYGQRPGSMRYIEIVHWYGSGEAIHLGRNQVSCEAP